MGTLANSENPDEMLHNTTFHQGLHYLLKKLIANSAGPDEMRCYSLRQNRSSEEEINHFWGNYNM